MGGGGGGWGGGGGGGGGGGLDEITAIIESREESAHIIVLGDCNGDVGSAGSPRGVRNATPRGLKVMNRHGLVPLNMLRGSGGPIDTYEGAVNGSTLDYVAIPAELLDQVVGCNVSEWSPLNTSDHTPVSHYKL